MREFLNRGVALSALAAALATAGAPLAAAQDETGTHDTQFVLPYYGDINPFYGDINPFYGDINPFYGDIGPFWGDISPFWGDINPFYGDIAAFWGDISPFYGDIGPFWGDIGPFWGDIGPFYGDISAFWGDIGAFGTDTSGDYSTLASQLDAMFAQAEAIFGPAVEAETGQSFRDAFLAGLTSAYGMDLSDPSSLEAWSASKRGAFFLDFYDGLMAFSGADHVDHWMPAINWSPALSQGVGQGTGALVGILDFSFADTDGVNLRITHGERDYLDFNHGAAVAGIIGAAHDGQGVMGIAPGVTINSYNPFDETLSTNWTDVRDGVVRLAQLQSNIVNMSLGVPGWTLHEQWATVFADARLAPHVNDMLFVIAAGNDGSTQTANIDWTNVPVLDNLLIVGSVNPWGEISSFSNRPGTACLTTGGTCETGNRLMDRFLVAPGELILVSDGEGGTVRMSGTSFAAPMVSGAAALVKGRWDWLASSDIASVLLQSATDLGDPGVDAVYGWGLLDVNGAMSPLDPDALFYVDQEMQQREVRKLGLKPGALDFHSADENSVTLFEPVGETYRDFTVSLDSVILQPGPANDGTNGGSGSGSGKGNGNSSSFISERVALGFHGTDFSDTAGLSRTMSARGDVRLSAFIAPSDPIDPARDNELGFQVGMVIENTVTGRELRFGVGEGALALSAHDGFGLFSDHRPETGGVNPVLGFASGGAYLATGMALNETTRISFGVTSARDEDLFVNPITGEETALFDGFSVYEAIAFYTGVQHSISDDFVVQVSYTHLYEGTGFLGAQGTGVLDLDGGASTDAVTVGAQAAMPLNLTLAVSATAARSGQADFQSTALSLGQVPVSTAFQASLRRDGVLGRHDAIRASVIQPLYQESGTLEYSAMGVADRSTGAFGLETQTWRLGGERPIVTELLYAVPLFGERGDLSLFARADLSGQQFDGFDPATASGIRFNLDF